MDNELKPSDVLLKCIENIDTWGWHQGRYLDPATGACCAMGHIRFASGYYVDHLIHDKGTLVYDYRVNEDAEHLASEAAIYLIGYRTALYPYSVTRWNDSPKRTKEEVKAAFKKAYKLALKERN